MPFVESFAGLVIQEDAPKHVHGPRTTLRLFKQATKAKVHMGDGKAMPHLPAANVVVVISDDDNDEEADKQPRVHTHDLPRSALFTRNIGNNTDDTDDSSNYSRYSSDSTSPASIRQGHLVQRPKVTKTRHGGLSSGDTSHDSIDMPKYFRSGDGPTTLNRIQPVKIPINMAGDQISSRPAQTQPSLQSAIHLPHPPPKISCEAQCPYYNDPKLEVVLYRGRGYERFPVVLGTVDGHKEICDKWDLEAKDKNKCLDSEPSNSTTTRTRTFDDLERERICLNEVLQVFPGIEHDFVRELHQKSQHELTLGMPEDTSVARCSNEHIAEIAEMASYPRERTLKRKALTEVTDETGVTIGWNRDLPKNSAYVRDAVILLAGDFVHIPTHHIAKAVSERQSLFDTFTALTNDEGNYTFGAGAKNLYKRLKYPRTSLEAKYRRQHWEQRDGHQYVSLVNELLASRQHQAREVAKIKRQKDVDAKESDNLALHIAQGSMVECQCCFDEKPINRAIACEGKMAHFFCNDCVNRQAESQVGAMKYEMLCMDISGCKADLSIDGVAQALSLKLYDKLAFNQQQAEIALAGIEGLESCPFCDFRAICEPVDIDNVFDCRNSECAIASCRRCKEKAHQPKTCKEIQKEKGLDARHQVEEARTLAMMRTCPNCKVKLIKEYGCNKMVCTNCSAVMCYVCQKDISKGRGQDGYEHFHRSGATCALHDKTGEDRHQQEADAAEKAAIAKVTAEHEDIDTEALEIETGKQAKGPKPKPVPSMPGLMPPVPMAMPMPGQPPREAIMHMQRFGAGLYRMVHGGGQEDPQQPQPAGYLPLGFQNLPPPWDNPPVDPRLAWAQAEAVEQQQRLHAEAVQQQQQQQQRQQQAQMEAIRRQQQMQQGLAQRQAELHRQQQIAFADVQRQRANAQARNQSRHA